MTDDEIIDTLANVMGDAAEYADVSWESLRAMAEAALKWAREHKDVLG